MAIPFATSMITILRPTLGADQDPYLPDTGYPNPPTTVVKVGVRAVVGVDSDNVLLSIGDRVVTTSKLVCDPCDIQEGDFITTSDGRIWLVKGPSAWGAFSLSGMNATLQIVEGVSP